jgi:hypothetical protein
VSSDTRMPATLESAGLTVIPTPSRIDLKTIDDVRLEMARVYRDMRAGTVQTQDGTRLAYVLAQIGKLIESGELERRIESLELVLRQRKLPK